LGYIYAENSEESKHILEDRLLADKAGIEILDDDFDEE
jgi:hypothetical protein